MRTFLVIGFFGFSVLAGLLSLIEVSPLQVWNLEVPVPNTYYMMASGMIAMAIVTIWPRRQSTFWSDARRVRARRGLSQKQINRYLGK